MMVVLPFNILKLLKNMRLLIVFSVRFNLFKLLIAFFDNILSV